MRAFVTRKAADGRREKRMIEDAAPPPAPGPDEVLVETMYSGLTNGTERNDLIGGNYATPDENLPAGMGYQNVGKVVELGADVSGLAVGDVVYSGTWLASDHAEKVTVPAQNFERFAALVKLPDTVEPQHAALFGIAAVGVRACRTAGISEGDAVLMVGLGLLGQIAAQVAKSMGATVTVCDINPDRLELARSIGAADHVVDTSGDGWSNNFGPERFDKVIDFAGVPGMEDQLVDVVKVFGTVLFIAGRARVNYDFNIGQFKEITIRQIAHFDNDDLAELTAMVAAGKVQIGPLIQRVVAAKDCAEVYDTLRDAPDQLLGCVFDWAR